MDTCNSYPKFQADQVLTADQLNDLFAFLDLQSRWTRKCFVGAGIAHGFRIETAEDFSKIKLSTGYGLTTLGYLVKHSATEYSHYRAYTDPVKYAFFNTAEDGQDAEQAELWQLLSPELVDNDNPDHKALNKDFLKDKIALAYLEVEDEDLDTCTGSDCNERGSKINLCVRILLIDKDQLDSLNQKSQAEKSDDLYQMLLSRYQLPQLKIGRLHWLGDSNHLLELEDILKSYAFLIQQGPLQEIPQAFRQAFDVYAPILGEDYQANPFTDWQPKLWNQQAKYPLGIQYYYDHIKDLILAYEEFIAYAFKVFSGTCLPDTGFAKHLMLGQVDVASHCYPSPYRHYFINATMPEEPVAGGKINRVKFLFQRLVLLTRAFKVPQTGSDESKIKITPSKEKETPLGKRSLPYYYDLQQYPQLKNYWDFDLASQCRSHQVISYRDNQSTPICVADIPYAKSPVFERPIFDIRDIGPLTDIRDLIKISSLSEIKSLADTGSLSAVKADFSDIKRSPESEKLAIKELTEPVTKAFSLAGPETSISESFSLGSFITPSTGFTPGPFPGSDPSPFPGFDPSPFPGPLPGPFPSPLPGPLPGPITGPDPRPTPFPLPLPKPEPTPIPQPFPWPRPIPVPSPDPIPVPGPIPVPTPAPAPVPAPVPAPKYLLLKTLQHKFPKAEKLIPHLYPLDVDQNEFPFYRIEGHLGENCTHAFNRISQWIKCYNLPIKLMMLKVGSKYQDITASLGCQFDDIELVYTSLTQKLICDYNKLKQLISAIEFDTPQDTVEVSETTKVKGKFIDGKTEQPLSRVYYAIKELNIHGQTNDQGEMEITNLPPGSYQVETYIDNYGSKYFPITVQDKKTLSLANIPLYQDALLDEKQLIYSQRVAENEILSKAKEYAEQPELYSSSLFDSTLTASPEKTRVSPDFAFKGDVFKTPGYDFGYDLKYDPSLFSSRNISLDLAQPDTAEAIKKAALLKEIQLKEIQLKETQPQGSLLSKQDFRINTAEIKASASPYKIDSLIKKINFDPVSDTSLLTKHYLYKNFANLNIREDTEIFDKVSQPVDITTSLDLLLKELQRPLANFDKQSFDNAYQMLLTRLDMFEQVIGKYDDYIPAEEQAVLLRYFNLVREQGCYHQFQGLLDSYNTRKLKIQQKLLLSVYSEHNCGMAHVGGCWAGGTFFLVYDDEKTVVLDFALPYICCSDCPPINLCSSEPVLFKLPLEYFCKNDTRKFKFITSPPGGEVIGSGVSKEVTTGDFYFTPTNADIDEGEIKFSYLINNSRYEFSALLAQIKAAISYKIIRVSEDPKSAEIKFTATPAEANEYLWDFGDGNSSNKANPVHTYDLTGGSAFTVNLRVKKDPCVGKASHELTFEICNANFTVEEVARSLDKIRYAFSHPQAAKTRVWQLDEGITVENQETVAQDYALEDNQRDVTVSLSITQETCSDSQSKTITIPARREVSIFIDRLFLCHQDVHEAITFDPPGGIPRGNGLVLIDGDYHFYPGHPDVILGANEISYEYQGKTVSVVVTVDAITEEFTSMITLIDADNAKAKVQFKAPAGMDSYAYKLGDGTESAQGTVDHIYDISAQTEFDVELQLIKGACEVTQTRKMILTPCSAEFTYKVVEDATSTGEKIILEYIMLATGGKEYQLTDELGSIKSNARVFQRVYPLGEIAREMPVTMRLDKPPCVATFTQLVTIPAFQPLFIKLETTEFVWCDKTQYRIETNVSGGKASGPGVREDAQGFTFTPALANTGGEVTLSYLLGERLTKLTVNLIKPQASFGVIGINKVDDGLYDIKLVNNSTDHNSANWLFSPGGSSANNDEVMVFRLKEVEPGQAFKVTLTVAWNELCPNSMEKVFHVPVDIIRIDTDTPLENLTSLRINEPFIKVIPQETGLTDKTMTTVNRVREDFSSQATAKTYVSGDRNLELSKALDPLLLSTGEQLTKVAIKEDAKTAQLGYPLMLTQVNLVLDLVTVMSNDLKTEDPMAKTLNQIGNSLGALMETGIELNKDNVLSDKLTRVKKENAAKPNVLAAINKIETLMS